MIDQASLVLSILFSITGGLLTLVGLIAIFISINTQHNIQKAREIYWQLQGFHAEYNGKEHEEATRLKLEHLYIQYEKLIEPSKVARQVINMANYSIVFVAFSWLTTLFWIQNFLTVNKTMYIGIIVVASIGLMIKFIFTLKNLAKIPSVADLPSLTHLKDINFVDDVIKMPYLAALSSELFLLRHDDLQPTLIFDYSFLPLEHHEIEIDFDVLAIKAQKFIENLPLSSEMDKIVQEKKTLDSRFLKVEIPEDKNEILLPFPDLLEIHTFFSKENLDIKLFNVSYRIKISFQGVDFPETYIYHYNIPLSLTEIYAHGAYTLETKLPPSKFLVKTEFGIDYVY